MLEHIRQFIFDRRLLTPGDSLLVGVSGGPDSVALLDVLVALQPEFGWELHVAHFNHQLRGDASDEDEDFVYALADAYNLSCTTGSEDVRTWAEDNGLSIEDAARRMRHRFFQEVADEAGVKLLALGHNADDQVETLLQRLLRGAGTHGLAAMHASNTLGQLTIVRPLLEVWKTEILAYLKQRGLNFRVDASNSDRQYQRNKIRHDLLPALEREYNPAIKTLLHQTAEILDGEDEWLEMESMRVLREAVPEPQTLLIGPLQSLHRAVQRRVIYHWLLDNGKPEKPLGADFRTVQALCRMLTTGQPGRWRLNGEHEIVRLEDRLELLSTSPSAEKSISSNYELALEIPGVTDVQPFGLAVEISEIYGDEIPTLGAASGVDLAFGAKFPVEFEEWLDADAVGDALTVRPWRPGDRFQPIGMDVSKKLQDIFVDEKMAPSQRRRTPLFVAANGEICWVFAYRIGEKFKIGETTRRALHIRVRPR